MGWSQQCMEIMRHREIEKVALGVSLAIQWLKLCASAARAMGSIPSWGTKILHAA